MDEREALRAELGASALDLLGGLKTRDQLLRAGPDLPFPDTAWSAIVDAGWFQTLLTADLGGLGLGLSELGVIFKAVGRRIYRGPLLDHAVTLPILAAEAPEAGRGRLLEGVEGKALVVLAEAPGAPWGAGLEAVSFRDGRLNGEVDLVPFAGRAARFVVVVSDGGQPALVLVEASACSVEPMPSHDPCIQYDRLRLTDVAVGPTDVLAAGAQAAALLERLHGALRLMAAAEMSGAATEATDMAVEYAKVREQFGRPIGGFQALRHLLARMAQRSSSLDNLVDACLADADADPARLPELGKVAKAYATMVGRPVVEDALQAHGGIGFTAEYPLHLHMRRVLTLQGYLGEAADLLAELGASALAG